MEYTLWIPDSVNPADVSMGFTLMHQTALYAERQALIDKNASLTTQLDDEKAKVADLTKTNERQSTMLAEALAEIKRLEAAAPVPTSMDIPPTVAGVPAGSVTIISNPPVIEIPLPPELPKPSPVFPFAGVYVENEATVNDQTQAKTRADAMIPMLHAIQDETPLTDVFLFCNPEDLKWGTLPTMLRNSRFRWWQSPAQAGYGKSGYIDRLEALRDAGVYGWVIDDASDTNKISKEAVFDLVDLIQTNFPGMPIIASMAARFDDSAYPHEKYIRASQWYLGANEKPEIWFPRFDALGKTAIYTADVHHDPAKMQHEFDKAMKLTQGIAWYGGFSQARNIIAEAKAAVPGTLTVFDMVRNCTAKYLKDWQVAHS